jgi:macrolide transport system ATP-binding/permease protein
MSTLLQDIRYALRQLRKAPGFTLTAVITLALGIGANTAIFTLVHGILLRSLPVADPSQLYRIGDTDDCCVEGGIPGNAPDTGDVSIFSTDLYQFLKNNSPEFEQLAAAQAGQWTWSVRRANEPGKSLHGEFVSGNYFSTLGINPYAGRLLNESDDTPSSAPAAVLSFDNWQSNYAADPSIVGSTIYIQSQPFTVAGITPPGFFGDRVTDDPPAFYMPIQKEPYVRAESSVLNHERSHWLYPIGRVRAGTNVSALQTKLTVLLRQWFNSKPELVANGGSKVIPKLHVILVPAGGGIQTLQQQTGKGLTMLMILSSVVLLIACANIANLLLARATSRRSEVAVRMAIGSARSRIVRQILTESILLGCIGGLAGLAVAYGGCQTILALAFPDARNMPVSANPSLPILGFAFLVALVTGILFGVAPAWMAAHAQPAEALRGSGRTTRDRSTLPQRILVVFQAALSVVLLTSAILLSRSLNQLEHQDFGVVTANRWVLHFDPAGAGYTAERVPILYREIEDRFAALPGVANVSLGMYSPLEGDNWGECVIQAGHPAPRQGDRCGATWVRVSKNYLQTIGVPVIKGRDFTAHDTNDAPHVALVNETFVKRFFPHVNPIGQHFGVDYVEYSSSFEIVGVFRDFKMNNPRDPVHPVYLLPLTQQIGYYKQPDMIGMEKSSMFMQAIILQFKSAPSNVDALVRRTLASVDPNLTVADLRSFQKQVDGNFNQERLIARLTGLFGVLALILASVGLYGVMSYFVVRRTSEIGIRMALGANRNSVVSMILRGALGQIFIGLLFGIPAAFYAAYLMKALLYGVGSYDPWAIAGAPLMLVLCATFAGFIPATRAASIEPMKALRTQ